MRILLSLRPKRRLLFVAGLGGVFTAVSIGWAQDWSVTGAPSLVWGSVAVSADGEKLLALGESPSECGYATRCPVPLFTSSSAGDPWEPASAPTNIWSSVACSANGTKLFAVANSPGGNFNVLYTSTNAGVTWSESTLSNHVNSPCIACSADGTTVLVGDNLGLLSLSTNSGASWSPTTAPSKAWVSVACSADGSKMWAVAALGLAQWEYGLEDGRIYLSTNSGASWLATSAPSNSWAAIACSANGATLIAAPGSWQVAPGLWGPANWVYISSDLGATWRTVTPAPNDFVGWWSSVACSADGRRLLAATGGHTYAAPRDGSGPGIGSIYSSTDAGATWVRTTAPTNDWRFVACSADGGRLVAMTAGDPPCTVSPVLPGCGGRIYTWHATSAPELKIQPAGPKLSISWLIPSSGFVLQESSDLSLTNWTDVASRPTLNYSNLRHEVTVSPSPGARFYRLRRH